MENGVYTPEWLGVVIVILPVAIFLIALLVVRKSLRGKVSLGDVLSETETTISEKKETDSSGKAVSSTEIKPEIKKKSASRLILFLSSITSLILGICFTSYYFYITIYCINCNMDMDLGEFSNILLALGIGVVPYAVNQVKRIKL
jgi:hypothetical protein